MARERLFRFGAIGAIAMLAVACQPLATLTGTSDETRDAVGGVVDTVVAVGCGEANPARLDPYVAVLCGLASGLLASEETDALSACAVLEREEKTASFEETYERICSPLLTDRADTVLRALTVADKFFLQHDPKQYARVPAVLFDTSTITPSYPQGCGTVTSSIYCPADRKMYLEVRQMERFDANGSILAGSVFVPWHERAHAYQHQSGQLQNYGGDNDQTRALEGAADCYAGAVAAFFDASDEQIEGGARVLDMIGGTPGGTHPLSADRVAHAKRGLEGGDCFVRPV